VQGSHLLSCGTVILMQTKRSVKRDILVNPAPAAITYSCSEYKGKENPPRRNEKQEKV
jgi:hypothetical protein